MRRNFAVTLLTMGVFAVGISGWMLLGYMQEVSERFVPEASEVIVTFDPPSTTTTSLAISEGDMSEIETTSTTIAIEPQWIDYPSPEHMLIEEIDIDVPAVVTGPNRFNAKGAQSNPVKGTVDLWVSTEPFTSVESVFVEPCELGLAYVTAHTLSKGGVGYNFVDYEYAEDDTGLPLGAKVVFTSETFLERTSCVYEIKEWPEWVPFPQLGETPARFYPKEPTGPILDVYIELVNQSMKPILALSTSYGGPSGREYQSNGNHKYYNAVLYGELIDIRIEKLSPNGGE